jgi:hypothetical protein
MEAMMTSTDPCAVYNFYNCCHDESSAAGDSSKLFVWQSAGGPDPTRLNYTSSVEPLGPSVGIGNAPNTSLKAYLGLFPVHRKAQLQDISFFRYPDPPSGTPYTGGLSLDLIVMDFNGAFIRTISTATLNYKTTPLLAWTPIPLSAIPGDLDILPGQVVAGQLTWAAALPPGSAYYTLYQLSGTGALIP